MATKTLTITENAYNALKERKLEDESFSQEILRLLTTQKRPLSDFFGILSEEEGERALNVINRMRELDEERMKENMKAWS
ncbi:antitoxin [archaeon]|jgi:predicted CopG family antitoxin|nr:antitoxin [archaeon]|tara:strand:- start:803 stop:1042 length:240 start_codon:yes stop_codon:yes gene_type:complete